MRAAATGVGWHQGRGPGRTGRAKAGSRPVCRPRINFLFEVKSARGGGRQKPDPGKIMVLCNQPQRAAGEVGRQAFATQGRRPQAAGCRQVATWEGPRTKSGHWGRTEPQPAGGRRRGRWKSEAPQSKWPQGEGLLTQRSQGKGPFSAPPLTAVCPGGSRLPSLGCSGLT